MATTNIERDERMQRQFGQRVKDFADNMRTAAQSMKKHADDASDNMKDASAQAALQVIKDLAEEILAEMPDVEAFGAKQIVLADYISDARSMRFGR